MDVNPNMANREVADLVLLDYKTKKVCPLILPT